MLLYAVGTPCLLTGSEDVCFHHYTNECVVPLDKSLHMKASGGTREAHRERIKQLLRLEQVQDIESRITRRLYESHKEGRSKETKV